MQMIHAINKITCIVLNNRERGQTLIEVLAALGAAVLVVSAISLSVVNALSNAQYAKNQNFATQYAQEGLDIMREMRNSYFRTFINYSDDTYCLDKGVTAKTALRVPLGAGCGVNVSPFVREVGIERDISCGVTSRKVSAYVSWSDSKCTDPVVRYCHQVHLETCLSDFPIVPTP